MKATAEQTLKLCQTETDYLDHDDVIEAMILYAERACSEQRTLCREKYVEVQNATNKELIPTAIQLTEQPTLK